MGATDHLSPDQFSEQGMGPFYHGTKSEFQPGDELTTRGAKQHLMQQGVRPVNAQHRLVYVTGSLGMAGAMAAADWTKGEKAHIYRVEPTGPMAPDPEVASPSTGALRKPSDNMTHSYVTRSPVKIIGEWHDGYTRAREGGREAT